MLMAWCAEWNVGFPARQSERCRTALGPIRVIQKNGSREWLWAPTWERTFSLHDCGKEAVGIVARGRQRQIVRMR